MSIVFDIKINTKINITAVRQTSQYISLNEERHMCKTFHSN